MDSLNGLVGVASSLNRPPLSLRLCISPLITPTAGIPTRKQIIENRPMRLTRRQRVGTGWRFECATFRSSSSRSSTIQV